jgi:hypothetical protein
MLLANCPAVRGRRPQGFELPPFAHDGSLVGTYLARSAYLDEASAIAYARLARELEYHRAPADLVERCKAARVAKLRHARAFGQLAAQRGVRPVSPKARVLPVRSLEEVALENIVEGFVREVYGAAVATLRARAAASPDIRRVMEEVAEDARLHAELALDLATWLQGVLDPVECAWVENAMRHAVVALCTELDREPEHELVWAAGVPSRRDALSIWSGLSHRVWHGLAERVWSAAAVVEPMPASGYRQRMDSVAA